ncbi:MAG: 2-octaprenylphenol hydroxylase [Pseudomonadales bacterium]
MVNTKQYDVVIVGAGLSGSALACALGESGLKIALLEGSNLPAAAPLAASKVGEFDPRVSALTEASREFLQQIDVWDSMQRISVSPYSHMTVWDAQGTGEIEFDAGEVQQPRLGHIVENRITNWCLLQRLSALPIDVFSNTKVSDLIEITTTDVAIGEAAYSLVLEDGSTMQASLVVAADGALSIIRTLAGFETREWDYNHKAIVATVECEGHHQHTAWQRFLPQGPLALLPLTDADNGKHYCSIVWSAELNYADELSALTDDEFRSALGKAFEYRLGEITAVSKRFSFPLRQRHAKQYFKPGLVLVGDAAHSIHPLAGQGINLGLQDVQVLAEEIIRGAKRGLAVGDETILRRYQRRRMADNLAMMAAMDGFKRLFERPELPVRWLRNEGLRLLGKIPAVKNTIIRQATGL